MITIGKAESVLASVYPQSAADLWPFCLLDLRVSLIRTSVVNESVRYWAKVKILLFPK